MATTATIVDTAVQADGRAFVKSRYDFDNGESRVRGPTLLDAGVNAQAHFDALIPVMESREKEKERQFAWQYGIDGNDIDTYSYLFNTTAEIQTYWWRRFMNFMRDESEDPDILDRNDMVATALVPLGYVNKNNNATIKNFIDDPAWGNNDVGAAISKANALYLGVINLDHGNPELSQ